MRVLALVALVVLAGCASPALDVAPDTDDVAPASAPPADAAPAPSPMPVADVAAARAWPAGADAVVIAVIDNGFDPYHLEWRAAAMPQHADADPSNDLPLDAPPHAWLAGFPDPSSFASYDALRLTLPTDPDAKVADAAAADADAWTAMPASTPKTVHFRWVPGTKVVGIVDFGDRTLVPSDGEMHGAKTTSVAAGATFGTCPECLLVFIQHGSEEEGIRWAMAQPWIDVVSNSYGHASEFTDAAIDTPVGDLLEPLDRTFVYDRCDLDLQREAATRGQTLVWSGSNGVVPGFVPAFTLTSCEFGPDWHLVVGGTAPSGGGHQSGKPVDVSGIAESYPSQAGDTVGGGAPEMGGTSNAVPLVAGTYGRALHLARAAMAGPSRVQSEGVVAVGAWTCGAARADCEAGDGVLTARELRTRLLASPMPTPQGVKLLPVLPGGPVAADSDFAAEGTGTFWGRFDGDDVWLEEVTRVVAPTLGEAPAPTRPDGEAAWSVVDSWCRQLVWGAWGDGDFVDGETSLPPPAPLFATRTAVLAACPAYAQAAALAREG